MQVWLPLLCAAGLLLPLSAQPDAKDDPQLAWIRRVYGADRQKGLGNKKPTGRFSTISTSEDHIDYLYGEWVPQGLRQWLETVVKPQMTGGMGDSFSKATFMDLGAGRGRASLMAFLNFDFQHVIGVEASDERFRMACEALDNLKSELNDNDALAERVKGSGKKRLTFFHSTFNSFSKVAADLTANSPVVSWVSVLDKQAVRDATKVWATFQQPSIVATIGQVDKETQQEASLQEALKRKVGQMTWGPAYINSWRTEHKRSELAPEQQQAVESHSALSLTQKAAQLEEYTGLNTELSHVPHCTLQI